MIPNMLYKHCVSTVISNATNTLNYRVRRRVPNREMWLCRCKSNTRISKAIIEAHVIIMLGLLWQRTTWRICMMHKEESIISKNRSGANTSPVPIIGGAVNSRKKKPSINLKSSFNILYHLSFEVSIVSWRFQSIMKINVVKCFPNVNWQRFIFHRSFSCTSRLKSLVFYISVVYFWMIFLCKMNWRIFLKCKQIWLYF